MTATQLTDTQAPDTAVSPDAMVSLSIGGMSCGACTARIERRLNDLDGVDATVNYASERARIALSPDTPVERLLQEIQSAGYSAELIEDLAPMTDPSTEVDQRARSLRQRLIVSALIFMPLCDLSVAFSLVPFLRFPGWQWLLIALAAPVVTWAAWPFYRAAVRNARHRTSTMDTLVSLGIVAATGWSLYAMFWRDTDRTPRSWLFVLAHQSGGAIYLDVAAGVTTFLLAGRYFEARSQAADGERPAVAGRRGGQGRGRARRRRRRAPAPGGPSRRGRPVRGPAGRDGGHRRRGGPRATRPSTAAP